MDENKTIDYQEVSICLFIIEKWMDKIEAEIPENVGINEFSLAYWDFMQSWGKLLIIVNKLNGGDHRKEYEELTK